MPHQDDTLNVSQEKACKMLEEGQANGQPLSDAQRRLFGARCAGQEMRRAENGSLVLPRDLHLSELDVILSGG